MAKGVGAALRALSMGFGSWAQMRNQDERLAYNRERDDQRQANLEKRWAIEDKRHDASVEMQKSNHADTMSARESDRQLNQKNIEINRETQKQNHSDNVEAKTADRNLREKSLNFNQNQAEVNKAISQINAHEKNAAKYVGALRKNFEEATGLMDKNSPEYQEKLKLYNEGKREIQAEFNHKTQVYSQVLRKNGYLPEKEQQAHSNKSLLTPPGEKPKVVEKEVLPEKLQSILSGLGYDSVEEARHASEEKASKKAQNIDYKNDIVRKRSAEIAKEEERLNKPMFSY